MKILVDTPLFLKNEISYELRIFSVENNEDLETFIKSSPEEQLDSLANCAYIYLGSGKDAYEKARDYGNLKTVFVNRQF